MWTKKGKYGLKAMLYLAKRAKGESTLVSEISQSGSIPHKFCEAILAELKNGGFLVSRKGRGGGYQLARPASAIAIGDVIRLLDGPLAPLACASRTRYRPCEDCPDEASCAVRLTTIQVRDAISDVLDHTSLQDMVMRAPEEEKILMYDI